MSKIKTLKMNYEFKNVLTRGKYFFNSQVTVYVLCNKLGYNRVGIAISSKADKAVRRNHIKRLIREAYRKIEKDLDRSYDIVIMWNKKLDTSKASYHKIYSNLENSFIKARLLNQK